jgi:hypothetical protein
MRVERSDHQRLPFIDGWLFHTVKFDPVAMDSPSVCGKLWFDQDTFKIRGGFKLVRLKNNGATPVGGSGGASPYLRRGNESVRDRSDVTPSIVLVVVLTDRSHSCMHPTAKRGAR